MRVHFIGVGGIAMSAVAGLAKELGFEVSGSEVNPVYPPASHILRDLGIEVLKSEAENIDILNPQIVVVGNAIRRDNAEVVRAEDLGKTLLSFPQFLERYVLPGKLSLVVAGTHGKTTTSALLAWSLCFLSEDPTFIVGGLLRETGKNYRYGSGKYVVLEGDEYPSAYFDPVAKFLHYHPSGLILTGLEYDHADVFPDLPALFQVFRKLIQSITPEGLLVYHGDDPNLLELLETEPCRVKRRISYGRVTGDFRLLNSQTDFNGKSFLTTATVADPAGSTFTVRHRLPGLYNSLNVLGVIALLEGLGFPRDKILKAIETFSGVKRRQEILYFCRNCLVVDDFAHHPTAVKVTLNSLKEAFKPEVTTLIFEPRTNSSKRKVFQEDYIEALAIADEVYIKEPPGLSGIPESERIDLTYVVTKLRDLGIRSCLFRTPEEFSIKIHPEKRQLIVFMSSAYMEREIENLLCEVRRIHGS